MKTYIKILIFISLVSLVLSSCKKEETEDPMPVVGNLEFIFDHQINGNAIVYDSTMYTNDAGNEYQINEIQYFVSDIMLYKSNGKEIMIDDWLDIYYVDVDIPSTLTWSVFDDLPVGDYDSISFIMGISEEKNQPYMFVNPPESYMFWPTFLGGSNGGYHYLKINGKWINDTAYIQPFDFHLGVGQIYAGGVIDVDSITDYVQNYFRVSLPNSSFTIKDGKVTEIQLVMNLENWFKNPHTYDHDVWGGYIMQNQDAMQVVKENGHDVFSIGYIQ